MVNNPLCLLRNNLWNDRLFHLDPEHIYLQVTSLGLISFRELVFQANVFRIRSVCTQMGRGDFREGCWLAASIRTGDCFEASKTVHLLRKQLPSFEKGFGYLQCFQQAAISLTTLPIQHHTIIQLTMWPQGKRNLWLREEKVLKQQPVRKTNDSQEFAKIIFI